MQLSGPAFVYHSSKVQLHALNSADFQRTLQKNKEKKINDVVLLAKGCTFDINEHQTMTQDKQKSYRFINNIITRITKEIAIVCI